MGNQDKTNYQSQVGQDRSNLNFGWNNYNQNARNQYNWGNQFDQNLAQQQYNRINNFNPNYSPTQSMIDDLWSHSSGISGGIDQALIDQMGADTMPGFKNFADNGGLSPQFNTQFGQNMAGVDTAAKGFQDLANQPVDPSQGAAIMGQIGASGGYDPSAQSGYANFAQTGGFSPTDIQNIRSRATAPTASIYQQGQDVLNQQRALGGGYSPNIAAAQAQMARDMSQQISQSDINAEAGLSQQIQQGKEYGLTGGTQAATQLADLTQRGKISGLTGATQANLAAAQARTQVQQLDDQMKLAGLQGMTDIEKTRLMGELQNAQINEQATAANAEINAQKAMQIFQDQYNAPIVAGQQGLQNEQIGNQLLGTRPGFLDSANQANYEGLMGQQQGDLGLLNAQYQGSQMPGGFSSFMGGLSQILGAGGQFGNLMNMFGNNNSTGDPGANQPGSGFTDANGNPLDPNNPGGEYPAPPLNPGINLPPGTQIPQPGGPGEGGQDGNSGSPTYAWSRFNPDSQQYYNQNPTYGGIPNIYPQMNLNTGSRFQI